MSLETVCSECGQRVGVVRAPSLGGEPPRYKVAIHADRDRDPSGRGPRRPRCGGTGTEPPASAITATAVTPDERRRRLAKRSVV